MAFILLSEIDKIFTLNISSKLESFANNIIVFKNTIIFKARLTKETSKLYCSVTVFKLENLWFSKNFFHFNIPMYLQICLSTFPEPRSPFKRQLIYQIIRNSYIYIFVNPSSKNVQWHLISLLEQTSFSLMRSNGLKAVISSGKVHFMILNNDC